MLMDWLAAHGGLVGLGVLAAKYSLLLFSVASVAVIFERALSLRRVAQLEKTEFARLRDLRLETKNLAPCAAIWRAGLENREKGENRMREAMGLELNAQIAALKHNLPILATAASTAPYIGLFGTVLGILAAFREIAATGQTGASVIAGGISEALTVTALGLGVAIPAVMAYNYFTGRVNNLSLVWETHALELAEILGTPIEKTEETDAPSEE